MIVDTEHSTAMVESVTLGYRDKIAKLEMQLVLYRQALEDNGIEPPDREGEELLELLRRCTNVISSAGEVVAFLGSSKEMVVGW